MGSTFDKTRYPVNSRGFAVVPCIRLVPENMTEELIGLSVTIGLEEAGGSTVQGTIHSFTDSKIVILVGGKKKTFDYNPMDIQLQCYQFGEKILFSNENIVTEKEQTPIPVTPSTPEPKVSHATTKTAVATPKSTPRKKTTRKKLSIKAAPVDSNATSASTAKASQSMPLYGISWE
jgi:hypothetical protein